ncbi:DNA pilot protein [Microviridae sp.]|nr:DNA pilot protein [Microviridae sp.]
MGLLGSIASAGFNALSSAAGGAFSQKQQYGYTKKERLKGPGWDVQGLRDAGLNPILAAQKSGPAHGVGGFAVSPADIAGQMEKISSSSAKDADASLKKESRRLVKEQQNTEISRQNVNNQLAEKTRSEAYLAMIEAQLREKTGHIQLNSKVLQAIEAINRAGGFGAVSSANDIFRTVRGARKKLTK